MTTPLSFTQQAIYTGSESYKGCGCVSVDESKYFTVKSDGTDIYQFSISSSSIGSRVVLTTATSEVMDMCIDPTDSDNLIIGCVDGMYRYDISANSLTLLLSSTDWNTATGSAQDVWGSQYGCILFRWGTKVVWNSIAGQHCSWFTFDPTTLALTRILKIGGFAATGGVGPDSSKDLIFGIEYVPTAILVKYDTSNGQLTVFSGTGGSGTVAGDALSAATFGHLKAATGAYVCRVPDGDLFYFSSQSGLLWCHNAITGVVTQPTSSKLPLALFANGTRAVVNSGSSIRVYS